MRIAYTMGNKKSYDGAFVGLANGKIPSLKKLGRNENYSGGCCWPTYKEAAEYIAINLHEIPYEPAIYGILLPNSWEEDTSDDTYEKEGFYSLLADSDLVMVNRRGEVIK